jgi:hypothetical protein
VIHHKDECAFVQWAFVLFSHHFVVIFALLIIKFDHLFDLFTRCFDNGEFLIDGCNELYLKASCLLDHPNLLFYQTIFGEVTLGLEGGRESTPLLEQIIAGILSG